LRFIIESDPTVSSSTTNHNVICLVQFEWKSENFTSLPSSQVIILEHWLGCLFVTVQEIWSCTSDCCLPLCLSTKLLKCTGMWTKSSTIINLSTTCRRMVSFKLRQFYCLESMLATVSIFLKLTST